MYSVPRKRVYRPFPNNGCLFSLHNYGFEQVFYNINNIIYFKFLKNSEVAH